VSDILNKTKCIDDVGLWSPDTESAFFQVCEWMDTCGRHGITQNLTKFKFALDMVVFAGFKITLTSIHPADKMIWAIHNFPIPQGITNIRSLFSLISQVSYCLSSSEELRPVHDLLPPKVQFYWDNTMDMVLPHAKSEILKAAAEGVRMFDKDHMMCLSPDFSKFGIGFSLGQKYCDCDSDQPWCCEDSWKLVFADKRHTHKAEEEYHPIEGEALAAAWALDKSRHFMLGCRDLILAVDHKPLLKVLGDRRLEDIKNP
jgi:hypothetical protein